MIYKTLLVYVTHILFAVILSGCELTSYAQAIWSPVERASSEVIVKRSIDNGDYLTAESTLLKLTRHYQDDFQYQLELSYLYLRVGEYMKAHRLASAVTKEIPNNTQAWELLGLIQLRLATSSFIQSQSLNSTTDNRQLIEWLLELQTGQKIPTNGHSFSSSEDAL